MSRNRIERGESHALPPPRGISDQSGQLLEINACVNNRTLEKLDKAALLDGIDALKGRVVVLTGTLAAPPMFNCRGEIPSVG